MIWESMIPLIWHFHELILLSANQGHGDCVNEILEIRERWKRNSTSKEQHNGGVSWRLAIKYPNKVMMMQERNPK
jgi:hypothetical protein